jgi:hypothetical protein
LESGRRQPLRRKKMTFAEAGAKKLVFGKHTGRTIDDVAKTNEGLTYLDWLRGVVKAQWLRDALDTYMDDESIARELEAAMRKGRS